MVKNKLWEFILGLVLLVTLLVGWLGFESPLVYVYFILELVFSVAYSRYLYLNVPAKDRRKGPFIFLAILNLFYFSFLIPVFFDDGEKLFLLPVVLLLMFHFGLKWNRDRSIAIFFPLYMLTFVWLIVQILKGFAAAYG